MLIGLIDVDGHRFPNLPLMKLAAWHKKQGDIVKWYSPFEAFIMPFDIVYLSKVFSFTPDYNLPIYADKIIRGGTGYAIILENGKEKYIKENDVNLPPEVENIYPDYTIYGEMTKDTAYGFLSRGCPRGCDFCHVKAKEGQRAYKVANLRDFWNGQKNIEILDPNILACKDWKELLQQLIDSKAKINFNQGLDIRLMTEEKAEMLSKIRIKEIHFAWDRYEDKAEIQPKFKTFLKYTKIRQKDLQVYVLCGDREKRVLPEDIERIDWLKNNGYAPYVTVYDMDNLPKGCDLLKLRRYVNNRFIFWKCPTFEEYQKQENI